MRLLVDYLCFTISRSDFFSEDANEQYIFERICGKMFLHGLNYQLRRSFYGYATTYNACGISICFGGREDIYIQMSGTGCRAFESLHMGLTWEKYIDYLRTTYSSLHVSRLDIACDTFDLLKIQHIQSYTMERRFVSRWKKYLCMIGSDENSVIFGSKQSDFRCRIYDKTQERREATGEQDIPDNWVRVEFQLRNEAAASFLRSWFSSGDLSATFFGLLSNQLMFYTKYDGIHRDRAKVAPWWRQLIGNAQRIKMAYVGGMEYNCESLRQYVLGQAGSSVRTYISLYGIDQLVADVSQRPLNDRQLALLNSGEEIPVPWEHPEFR